MADEGHRRRVAIELNALHASGALGDVLEGARIGVGTPVYDLNGDLLFERLPLTREGLAGHADMALHPAVGSIVMSVSPETPWDEGGLLELARRAAGELLGPAGLPPEATARFVAYSLPKVAVQFVVGDRELAMLDAWSLQPVPPLRDRAAGTPPEHFERWSFLGDLSKDEMEARANAHARRVEEVNAGPGTDGLDVTLISRKQLALPGEDAPGSDENDTGGGEGGNGGGPTPAPGGGPTAAGGGPVASGTDQRSLHYSRPDTTHSTCFEKQPQQTNQWCVAASVQMLLDFYRYEYAQERIAAALGLGTRKDPQPLPNSKWDLVVTEIQALTSGALSATKVMLNSNDPLEAWQVFRAEILANRPAISFVAGHSRTVGGYFDRVAAGLSFKGLVIYDPYAPGAGPSYEECRYARHKCAFTARVR